MDYELAAKLKAAGFPQTYEEGKFYTTDGVVVDLHEGVEDRWGAYVPTLGELINACVGVLLWGCEHGWYASRNFCPSHDTFENTKNGVLDAQAQGSTPSEAVAHLYLALNAPKENQT